LPLSTDNGLVIHGTRVVPPAVLRRRILEAAHDEVHPSFESTKAHICKEFWWPGLDRDVRQYVEKCRTCAESHPLSNRKIDIWPPETTPWSRVHMDHCEVSGVGLLLLLSDAYSGWPEAIQVPDKSTDTVMRVLRAVFARNGVPQTLVSDNAPEFKSTRLSQWLDSNRLQGDAIWFGCAQRPDPSRLKFVVQHGQNTALVTQLICRLEDCAGPPQPMERRWYIQDGRSGPADEPNAFRMTARMLVGLPMSSDQDVRSATKWNPPAPRDDFFAGSSCVERRNETGTGRRIWTRQAGASRREQRNCKNHGPMNTFFASTVWMRTAHECSIRLGFLKIHRQCEGDAAKVYGASAVSVATPGSTRARCSISIIRLPAHHSHSFGAHGGMVGGGSGGNFLVDIQLVNWHTEDSLLACAWSDGCVRLWRNYACPYNSSPQLISAFIGLERWLGINNSRAGLAFGGHARFLRLIDAHAERRCVDLPCESAACTHLAYSDESAGRGRLIAGFDDGIVKCFDPLAPANQCCVCSVQADAVPVGGVSNSGAAAMSSPAGDLVLGACLNRSNPDQLLTCTASGLVRLWDLRRAGQQFLESHQPPQQQQPPQQVTCFAAHPRCPVYAVGTADCTLSSDRLPAAFNWPLFELNSAAADCQAILCSFSSVETHASVEHYG
uniref:Integrase catalytic domain-containing protein n=1 Tax=Macrostomum lignano TaxID=282301 RepID=A0A1I8FPI9_9PLAT